MVLYGNSADPLDERIGHSGGFVSTPKVVPAFCDERRRKCARKWGPSVNYTSSAPTRQVEPEVPDADIVASPVESDAGKGTEQTLAHLQLLWRNRALLLKFGLCALLAITLVAFLIPPDMNPPRSDAAR